MRLERSVAWYIFNILTNSSVNASLDHSYINKD